MRLVDQDEKNGRLASVRDTFLRARLTDALPARKGRASGGMQMSLPALATSEVNRNADEEW